MSRCSRGAYELTGSMDEQQFLHDAGDNLKPPGSNIDGTGSVSESWFAFVIFNRRRVP